MIVSVKPLSAVTLPLIQAASASNAAALANSGQASANPAKTNLDVPLRARDHLVGRRYSASGAVVSVLHRSKGLQPRDAGWFEGDGDQYDGWHMYGRNTVETNTSRPQYARERRFGRSEVEGPHRRPGPHSMANRKVSSMLSVLLALRWLA